MVKLTLTRLRSVGVMVVTTSHRTGFERKILALDLLLGTIHQGTVERQPFPMPASLSDPKQGVLVELPFRPTKLTDWMTGRSSTTMTTTLPQATPMRTSLNRPVANRARARRRLVVCGRCRHAERQCRKTVLDRCAATFNAGCLATTKGSAAWHTGDHAAAVMATATTAGRNRRVLRGSSDGSVQAQQSSHVVEEGHGHHRQQHRDAPRCNRASHKSETGRPVRPSKR